MRVLRPYTSVPYTMTLCYPKLNSPLSFAAPQEAVIRGRPLVEALIVNPAVIQIVLKRTNLGRQPQQGGMRPGRRYCRTKEEPWVQRAQRLWRL
jgi:hypothetical protein